MKLSKNHKKTVITLDDAEYALLRYWLSIVDAWAQTASANEALYRLVTQLTKFNLTAMWNRNRDHSNAFVK